MTLASRRYLALQGMDAPRRTVAQPKIRSGLDRFQMACEDVTPGQGEIICLHKLFLRFGGSILVAGVMIQVSRTVIYFIQAGDARI